MNFPDERVLEQSGVALKGRRQERLAGDEKHHEFWRRAQRRPVTLRGQLIDMVLQVPGVRGHPGLAHLVPVGLRRLQVSRERDLGVDDDVLSARQPHHKVRPHKPKPRRPRVPGRDLLIEVTASAHARQLHDPAQLHLAPSAARLRPAKRCHQRLRLDPELLRRRHRELHLLAQRRVRALPRRLALAQLRLDPCQRLPERLDQLFDRIASRIELARRTQVRGPKPDLAELHQPLLTLIQGLCRKRLKSFRQITIDQLSALRSGLVDQRRPVNRRPSALVSGTGLSNQIRRRTGQLAPGVEVANGRPKTGAHNQPDKQQDRTHARQCCQCPTTVARRVHAATASVGHRCCWAASAYRNGGPSMLLPQH